MSQGPGWWQASDGRWYPPREADGPPAPGWWLASDGKWYPPKESEDPPHPGWWLASDGKWYPPRQPVVEAEPEVAPEPESVSPAETAEPASLPERPPRSLERARTSRPASAKRGPAEQIRRRNEASRQDAVAQAPARFLAAARAVQQLESELGLRTDEPSTGTPTRRDRPGPAWATVAAPAPEPEATLVEPTLVEPTTVESPEPVVIEAASVDAPEPSDPTDVPEPEPDPTFVDHAIEDLRPLIEVRSSPLGADIEHLGDRLVVYRDRVELHDRSGAARHAIAGSEIVDVIVHRRFTGAVLTVESGSGQTIVLKGVKPDLADEVAGVIRTRTRQGRPPLTPSSTPAVPATPASLVDPSADAPTSVPSADAVAHAANRLAILNRDRLNEAELLRKLADLHRAGVLSDTEFQDKISLVGRLVSGETILVR